VLHLYEICVLQRSKTDVFQFLDLMHRRYVLMCFMLMGYCLFIYLFIYYCLFINVLYVNLLVRLQYSIFSPACQVTVTVQKISALIKVHYDPSVNNYESPLDIMDITQCRYE
jgi:hypothetical protein